MKIFLSVLLSLLISSAAMSQVCPNSVTLRMDDSECPIGATCTGKGAPLTLLEHDRNLANVAAICLWADGVTGGSGTSVILDLADDGTNESTALAEIAVTNDTRSAFTEPSANKLLIDVNKIRLPSLLNPRVTPHAYDCEFDSGLCAGYSWVASPAPSDGTVDPFAAQGPIYDTSSWPGWLLLQLDGTSGAELGSIQIPLLSSNDFTVWSHVLHSDTSVSTSNPERTIYFVLKNSGDENESAACGFHTTGTSYVLISYVANNGTFTSVNSGALPSGSFLDSVIVFWKKDGGATDNYGCGVFSPTGGWFQLPTVTKTGVVAFDEAYLSILGDNTTPSPIIGVDFVRFAESIKLPEMN